jgi:D-alanyl-D-alanine carboxypeptidase
LLDDPDLEDMFAQAYPRDSVIFLPDYDPGRCRPNAFFMKLYGGSAEEVRRRLVPVDWLGQRLQFNGEAGAAAALARVAKRLAGSPALLPFLKPSAGTFNWRLVAGTQRLSNHSFGIAIDLNVAHAHYWRWSKEFKAGKPLVYQNKIPKEIVAAFEAEGFIWGGKWYHYDTMHFEYRPELGGGEP